MQLTPQINLVTQVVIEQFEGPILSHWTSDTGQGFAELVYTRNDSGFLVSLFVKLATGDLITQYTNQQIDLRTLLNWDQAEQKVWQVTYQQQFFEVEEVTIVDIPGPGPLAGAMYEPDLAE